MPEDQPRGPLAGVPSMCLAMLVWPVIESLARVLSRPYSPFEVVWVRYGTHLLLMLVIWTPRGPARLLRTDRPGLHMVRALMMLGLPVFSVFGTTRMPENTVMSIFWSTSLLAMLLASIWLGERVGWRRWLAAMIAYAGALVILHPSFVTGLAVPASLAMAACFAVYQVLTRHLRDETTAARLFYTALGVWLPLGVVVPWSWRTPTPRDLVVMMAIGVLGFVILLGFDRALDVAPVSTLAPFTLAQPIWSLLVGASLGHRPELRAGAGVGVVLAAWVVFAWVGRARGAPTLH